MGYSKDAIKGISWISLLRVLTRVLTFVRLAVLGRILSPVQFGYFGIASLILSLLEILTETGMNVFLVQEKNNFKDYINSAWIVSIIRGIILSAVILISSSAIAAFFNINQAVNLLLLIAVVPLIRGFINPAIIIYQKDLLFHKEFRIRFVLFLIDVIISIITGLLTRSAISFVYGLIASAIIEVILSYILFPNWPKLIFEKPKIKLIFNKGKWITLTGIFSYIADNGDTFVVGKILGSGALGIYQIAYKFSTLSISEITNVINQVTFPVYSKFSNDKKRILSAFAKVTLVGSVVAVLLGAFIYLYAKELILIIMGDQWLSAVPVMQILVIYAILRTVFGNFAPLFLALGKQNYVAQMTSVRAITLIAFIFIFVSKYGIIGASYAMLLSIIMEIPMILYYIYKILRKDFNNIR